MAKKIQKEDLSVLDPFELIRKSAAATQTEVNALMADLEAVLPITKQMLEGKGSDVRAIDAQKKALERLNKEVERAEKLQAKSLKERELKAKALAAEELATQRNIRTKSLESREKERLAKLTAREIKNQEKLSSSYMRVDNVLKEVNKEMRDLQVRKELGGKLDAKQEFRLATLTKRQGQFLRALSATDVAMGKHNRNVGNYASGFNGLSFSIAQLTREAPAFANSMATGFMAISNNIPMAVDEINRLRLANKQLAADGKATTSVLKSIGSAIFSWHTLLSVGVTLLTIYGAKMVSWIAKITEGTKEVDKLAAAQERAFAFSEKLVESTAKESKSYINLVLALKNSNKETSERKDLIKKINEQYGTTLKNISDEKLFQDQLNSSVKDYLAFKTAEFELKRDEDRIENNLKAQQRLKKEIWKANKDLAKQEEDLASGELQKTFIVGIGDKTDKVIDYKNANEAATQGVENQRKRVEELNKELDDAKKRFESYGVSAIKIQRILADLEKKFKGKETKTDPTKTPWLNLPDIEEWSWADAEAYWAEVALRMREIADKALEDVRIKSKIDVSFEDFIGDVNREAKVAKLEVLKSNETEIEQSEKLLEIEIKRLKALIELERLKGDKADTLDLEIQLAELEKSRGKEAIKNTKELKELLKEVAEGALQILNDAWQRDIDNIKRQMDLVQDSIDSLNDAAAAGDLRANESLAQRLKLARELDQLQQKAERRKAQVAAISSGVNSLISAGGLLNLSQIPGFEKGTETTLGEHMKPNLAGVGVDNMLIRAKGDERILNAELSAPLRGYKNTEVVKGFLESKRQRPIDTTVIAKEVSKAIQGMPQIDYNVAEVSHNAIEFIRKQTKGNVTSIDRYKSRFNR